MCPYEYNVHTYYDCVCNRACMHGRMHAWADGCICVFRQRRILAGGWARRKQGSVCQIYTLPLQVSTNCFLVTAVCGLIYSSWRRHLIEGKCCLVHILPTCRVQDVSASLSRIEKLPGCPCYEVITSGALEHRLSCVEKLSQTPCGVG